MSIKSVIDDGDGIPVMCIVMFWSLVVTALIFAPVVGDFIVSAWLMFGCISVILLSVFLYVAKIKCDGLVLFALVITLFMGVAGLLITASIMIYYYGVVLKREREKHEKKMLSKSYYGKSEKIIT